MYHNATRFCMLTRNLGAFVNYRLIQLVCNLYIYTAFSALTGICVASFSENNVPHKGLGARLYFIL